MKSEISGVCFMNVQQRWIARDSNKKTLYRGISKTDAEAARIAYDKAMNMKTRTRGVTGYKNKCTFVAFQPEWMPSKIPASDINDGYFEP